MWGKKGAAEILGNQISWAITEKKIVGNKLIFKGMLFTNLLYRSVDGTCCSVSAELPFSQIMEVDTVTDNAEVSLSMQLTGTDIQIDGGDPEGRELSVMLYFRGTALLREKQELRMIKKTDGLWGIHRTTLPVSGWVVICREKWKICPEVHILCLFGKPIWMQFIVGWK